MMHERVVAVDRIDALRKAIVKSKAQLIPQVEAAIAKSLLQLE